MVERIAKMIENIISGCDDLKKWKSYKESGIEGIFPPYFKEIDATNEDSEVYKCVGIGLQNYLNEYTDCEIEHSWDLTLDEYLNENKSQVYTVSVYARDYAIVRMELKNLENKFYGDPSTDAFFDALSDAMPK